jgi:EAL domain-containing protein (putative c-di-GMP-specific phosphodiesterase class I)
MRRVGVANSNATSVNALQRGELFLVFQPIFNLQTKKIAGCEALLRWKHPNLGVQLPNEFMKVMEETGLITDVGEWVLVQACKAAVAWPVTMRVAVNVSAVKLQTSKLLSSVVNALISTLPARRLEIEITETAVIDDGNQVLSNLKELPSTTLAPVTHHLPVCKSCRLLASKLMVRLSAG